MLNLSRIPKMEHQRLPPVMSNGGHGGQHHHPQQQQQQQHPQHRLHHPQHPHQSQPLCDVDELHARMGYMSMNDMTNGVSPVNGLTSANQNDYSPHHPHQPTQHQRSSQPPNSMPIGQNVIYYSNVTGKIFFFLNSYFNFQLFALFSS